MLELWLCPSRKQNTARVMQALEAAGLSPMARPEQLTLEDFCALQKALND